MAFLGKSSGKPMVGLDIGSSLIKAVELRPGKDAFRLTALAVMPTPEGMVDGGNILAPADLGQAIKGLLASNGFSTKNVVSSVSGQQSLVVRIIEVPLMTETELKETMRWEIERHVPFSSSEIVMDYVSLPPNPQNPDAQNMEVLMAVAQEGLVSNHLDTIAAAGLTPKAIDIEPLASARALVNISDGGGMGHTVAIVNIGASATDFSIIRNGDLIFPRILPIAGNTFTKAIADVMGKTMDEAERLKCEYATARAPAGAALPPPEPAAPAPEPAPEPPAPTIEIGGDAVMPAPPKATTLSLDEDAALGPVPPRPAPPEPSPLQASPGGVEAEVCNAISPVLSDLADEIGRSLQYYRSRAADQEIEKLLLTGGTMQIRGLAEYLEGELQIPVGVADPTAYVRAAGPKVTQQHLDEVGVLIPVALGLAMRDMLIDTSPKRPKVKAPKAAAAPPDAGDAGAAADPGASAGT
jgi:type IV pilus assembly protein PilM